MIRALAPAVTGSWLARAARMLRSAATAGQAAVIELEQESGRDVVNVGGQGERAELVVAVEQLARGAQAAEQAGQQRDQVGVAAGLVLPPGVICGNDERREVGRGLQRCWVHGVPGKDRCKRLGVSGRPGPRDAVENRADHRCAGEPDEGTASHWVVLLPVPLIEGKQARGGRHHWCLERSGSLLRGQPQGAPGGIRQSEAVGDALEYLELLDQMDDRG